MLTVAVDMTVILRTCVIARMVSLDTFPSSTFLSSPSVAVGLVSLTTVLLNFDYKRFHFTYVLIFSLPLSRFFRNLASWSN